jgi:single-stranded DNA-binding protein
VIVTGRLQQRSYETREGEKRTVVELEVDEIGPSLRYATAKLTRSAELAAAVPAVASVAATAVPAMSTPGDRHQQLAVRRLLTRSLRSSETGVTSQVPRARVKAVWTSNGSVPGPARSRMCDQEGVGRGVWSGRTVADLRAAHRV